MNWNSDMSAAPKCKPLVVGIPDGWDGPPYYSKGEQWIAEFDDGQWVMVATGEPHPEWPEGPLIWREVHPLPFIPPEATND